MSRGLGSMQQAIMAAMESKGGSTYTSELMFIIGTDMEKQGKHVIWGPHGCFHASAFEISFYRALNGLKKRKLLIWHKESRHDGEVWLIPEGMSRIKRERSAGYQTPPNTRYIGRGSDWGNPYSVEDHGLVLALLYYEKWLDEQLKANPHFLDPLADYKNLSCWCPLDKRCHGDILLRKMKELDIQLSVKSK